MTESTVNLSLLEKWKSKFINELKKSEFFNRTFQGLDQNEITQLVQALSIDEEKFVTQLFELPKNVLRHILNKHLSELEDSFNYKQEEFVKRVGILSEERMRLNSLDFFPNPLVSLERIQYTISSLESSLSGLFLNYTSKFETRRAFA